MVRGIQKFKHYTITTKIEHYTRSVYLKYVLKMQSHDPFIESYVHCHITTDTLSLNTLVRLVKLYNILLFVFALIIFIEIF